MISPYCKTVLTILLVAILASCDKKKESAATPRQIQQAEVAPVKVVPLGKMIWESPQLDDSAKAAFIEKYSGPLSSLLNMSRIADTVSVVALREYAAGRSVTMFQPEINKAFPALTPLDSALTAISGRMATILPDLRFPTIYSVVIPFKQSIIAVNDTTLFIGLNHYLGTSHQAYNGFAEYIRRLKEPSRAPIDITEAVIGLSNPYEGDNVISRLLYEGAVIEALMQAASIDEATALGYDDDSYAWAVENEKAAWQAIVSNKMLFSTDADLIERLVSPAPATSVLNGDSPGRLGRFIGHRIVSAYLDKNKNTKMSFLLSPDFYNSTETLAKASYQNQ